jgi:hypothetical protein
MRVETQLQQGVHMEEERSSLPATRDGAIAYEQRVSTHRRTHTNCADFFMSVMGAAGKTQVRSESINPHSPSCPRVRGHEAHQSQPRSTAGGIVCIECDTTAMHALLAHHSRARV